MAKKKTAPQPVVEESRPEPKVEREPTDLEKVEAEMRDLSPTLPGLKRNDPAKYKLTYKRFMWLAGERDRLQNG